jgi:hypothetical protein
MKRIIYPVIFILILCCSKKESNETVAARTGTSKEIIAGENPQGEIKDIDYSTYYKEAKQYCKKNNLNQDQFILIDLGVHSGLKRFFIYDFNKKEVLKSYVVSHGCGDNNWSGTFSKENAPLSNEFDSHCSSTGKYIVLDRGVSQWGIKVNYVLLGKDITNSNAKKRAIVLHSWEAISTDEVYPEGTPEGWGCPAVSNESMKEIDEILKKNKKILMWIIKS